VWESNAAVNFAVAEPELAAGEAAPYISLKRKCCTCVNRSGRGHTVSAEPAGHTSCYVSYRSEDMVCVSRPVTLIFDLLTLKLVV